MLDGRETESMAEEGRQYVQSNRFQIGEQQRRPEGQDGTEGHCIVSLYFANAVVTM
jgi:hypothetical protein